MSGWKRWADERPPSGPGVYRWRATVEVLGKTLTPEWTEKMERVGMGYGDPEYWPLSPCHWDGYRRYMTADVEWRELRDDDPEGVVWHGFNLLPCPFSGKPPKIEYSARYIGAPPYRPESLVIRSFMVHKWFRDANSLEKEWNTRDGITPDETSETPEDE